MIAYAVEEGFQSGAVGSTRWEVNFEKHDWDNNFRNERVSSLSLDRITRETPHFKRPVRMVSGG